MSEDRAHVSSFTLDAMALGALSSEEAEQVRAHLSNCARCAADFEEATAARDHFARDVLPRTARRFRRIEEPRRFSLRILPMLLAPSLAAAVVAIFVLPSLYRRQDSAQLPGQDSRPPILGQDLRIKGEPILRAAARRGDRTLVVQDGAVLAPGDEVHFFVQASGFEYLLIASVDADGDATVYFPYGGAQSALLQPTEGEQSPGSIVLDESRGPERVYAFFSHRPLPSAAVLAELRGLAARGPTAIRAQRTLSISADAQSSIWFEKRVGRRDAGGQSRPGE